MSWRWTASRPSTERATGCGSKRGRRPDLVVLWGCNALATNLHFLSRVKEAKRKGGRAFLIDTYRQPTAALVDRAFLVKPGSGGALALGHPVRLQRAATARASSAGWTCATST